MKRLFTKLADYQCFASLSGCILDPSSIFCRIRSTFLRKSERNMHPGTLHSGPYCIKVSKMKTLSSLCLMLAVVLSLDAAPECERLSYYDTGDLRMSFQRDLVSHVWTSNVLGAAATLYFQEDGSLIVVPESTSRIESYLWDVAIQDGQAMLQIIQPDGKLIFGTAPTCSGLCISQAGKCVMMFAGEAEDLSVEHELFLETQLSGTWKYTSGRVNKRSMPLEFTLTLNADGTFTMASGPDSYHSLREGVWQVTPDGEYLILFTSMDGNSGPYYAAEYIPIRSVDFEDLVIGSGQIPKFLDQNNRKHALFLSKS